MQVLQELAAQLELLLVQELQELERLPGQERLQVLVQGQYFVQAGCWVQTRL